MPAVLVAVPTVKPNLLHPLSTSSITARHLLEFMVQEKITEADAPTIRLDATPSGLSLHYLCHFYAKCPFCCNPHNLSWLGTYTHTLVCVCACVCVCVWDRYRIMLACIPSGLVYAATQKTRKTSTRTHTHLTALCPGQPG